MSVSTIDSVLLVLLLVSMLLGAWRGLVYELLSLVGWVVAFVAARYGADSAGQWLPLGESDAAVRYAAGFVLVFVGAAFAWGLLSALSKRLIEGIGLRPVDRTLGAVFGLLRGGLLVLVLVIVVGHTPMQQAPWWQQSWIGTALGGWSQQWVPVLPQEFGRHLPS